MGLSCFKSWKYDSTGHKGNRDVLASPGSYFFLSNSAGQGDEWLKSLNKGVWIPFTGVFGQRLEETVLYERRYGVRLVPLVVEQCVTFIRERGLHEVGLFRQPGRTSLVKELQEAFDSGERPSFDSGTDVHTVASLLKLYLRQLPEPLVPYSHYQDFLLCGQKLLSDRTVGLEELTNLLHELPVANFNLLNFICQFLNEVQSCSSSNKMNVQNLATVFGPNILRAKAEDPQSIMGATKLVQVLMSELIRQHKSLFAKFPPSACSHPSATPLKQPHLQPPPCLRQLSLPLIADHSSESGQPAAHADHSSCIFSAAGKSDLLSGQKKHLGHRYTSSHPENCFYPLPSSSESINHHPGRHKGDFYKYHSGQGSSSANAQATTTNPQLQAKSSNQGAMGWQCQEKAASASWSCRGAEEEGEVPEAASGGSSQAQEDSTPSVYDNLDRASLSHTLENVPTENFDLDSPGINVGMCETEVDRAELGTAGDSSSSWSSCEVLPLDKSKDDLGVSSPDIPPKRSRMLPLNQRTEQEICDKDDHEDNGVEGNGAKQHPSSWASCSVISISPLSTGSSEVFLPSGAPDLQVQESHLESRDTHSLLAKLRQQMAQQKAEYQNRIERLERCNDALERQVAVLRLSLEQQRRSQSVAEIKIRNMERAKADADRRNTTLQREMELFFRTYGEIRRRGGDLGRAGGGSI
ncbi:PREDICTED: rho GTPase-activating protein 22-like isoform X1 [Poecilia mexicana]|uniref:rho GTPase-activating protein 22-like isoform X1 n=1 Tax=Poecilia mexicana TaxID=48701 RepID=UPI00072DFA2A|nr:PREDICTED: rho GTPase-activating protein 22-like isoform X1 [Poecilia mexicana]